ncbi:tRNA pseudouridine(55) synthase TruB [beta proteobacterium MWH-UniP1]
MSDSERTVAMQVLVRPPKKQRVPVDGVLLLDKPVGPSSSRVLGHVKHLLSAAKAGHGGTLDPMASGLLPIMFGEATKYAAEGLDADKTYVAQIALGAQTTTGDREGDVIAQAAVPSTLSVQQVTDVLARFLGPQKQTPPLYSAIKKDGRPLYDYARAGERVEREPRSIVIHELSLQDMTLPNLQVLVKCSKGTYVRTLAEDIGAALGLPAHLHSLRRVGVGSITADDMVSLVAFEQASDQERLLLLKPVDWLIRDWPQVVLGAAQVRRFVHGQSVMLADSVLPAVVRVKTQSGDFIGTGRVDTHHLLSPERVRVLSS